MCNHVTKTVCLIGLGRITQRYVTGLAESTLLRLCAVADLNENAMGRLYYSHYPFYTDYKEMLAAQKPDYAIISTPPATHFEIANYCLDQGIHIIVEKPAVLCMEDFCSLQKKAEEKDLVFYTRFHWNGGIEVQAFAKKFRPEQIQSIRSTVLDPYCDTPDVIKPERQSLMGVWVDSGVNILSMISQWLPFKNVKILSTETERCKETGLPLYVHIHLLIDGVPTEITVDWRQGIERKESFVEVDGQQIHIDHSGQCLAGKALADKNSIPRLDYHYVSLFSQFNGSSNTDLSAAVHKLLFEVDALL